MSTQPPERRLVTEAALAAALSSAAPGTPGATPTATAALVFTDEATANAAPDGTLLLRYRTVAG